MRLTGISQNALKRIQKAAQWDVDESGQAVPMGTQTAPGASGDVSERVTQLETKFQEQNQVLIDWVDYLNQYQSGLAENINEIWTDVNTIGDDVTQLKEQVKPTKFPQQQAPTTYSDLFQGTMSNK